MGGSSQPIDIWPLIFTPAAAMGRDTDAEHAACAGHFAEMISPALAQFWLAAAEQTLGTALVDPDLVRKSRLANRFNVVRQWDALNILQDAGIETVCLKGFANGHEYYASPEQRCTGDLDVLIHPEDLDSVLQAFHVHRYLFQEMESPVWGFLPDNSFMPLVSPDGACNLDIHISADAYPFDRALNCDQVFGAAHLVETDRGQFLAPLAEHAFLLCVSNAAKDKFGPFSTTKILDAALILQRETVLDWEQVVALARRGRLLRPLKVFCALLGELCGGVLPIPEDLSSVPSGLAKRPFKRVVAGARSQVDQSPGLFEIWQREWTLCAEPDIALHNVWRRFRGLFRPRSGLPENLA